MSKHLSPFEFSFTDADSSLENWPQFESYLDLLLEREINSEEDLMQWFQDENEVRSIYFDERSRANVNLRRDSRNNSYKDKYDFINKEIVPKMEIYTNKAQKKLVKTEAFNKLKNKDFKIYKNSILSSLEIFNEENITLYQETKELANSYMKLSGEYMVEMDGERHTPAKLRAELKSPDRDRRLSIYSALSKAKIENNLYEKFDDIMNELIAKRHQGAINADQKDFVDFTFLNFNRTDYTKQDCKTFHETIQKEFTPIYKEICLKRKEDLGVEKLKLWDKACDPQGREPLRPFENSEELIRKTEKVLRQTDPTFAEYLQEMEAGDQLDLDAREGKSPGGFISSFSISRLSFLFMNGVGSDKDVKTMVHEMGHAAQNFLMDPLKLTSKKMIGMEVAELAAMGMEYLTMDKWNIYYPDAEDLKRAKQTQLETSIELLCWAALIDKFQFWLYENPKHTVEERDTAWLTMHKALMGDNYDYSDFELQFRKGWQAQRHIFNYPFYYIEYAFARLGSLAIYRNYCQTPQKTIDQYKTALALGSTESISDVYKAAGIEFRFDSEYVHSIASFIKEKLAELA